MNTSTVHRDLPDADELAGIVTAYTEVTERLSASHERLLEEVRRLREELRQKNAELERRSRLAALGQMAAGMAHEIRNPLGGIALYAGLLRDQLAEMPNSRTLAERIATGVARLDVIVSDILAFAGEIKPQCRPTALSAVVHEAAELVQGRLDKAGTCLTIDVEQDGEIHADRVLLVRALCNLLFNAIDAAGDGEVRLEARLDSANATLRVSDSGTGVPADATDKLFNPFFTTKDTGTGLGLAIVHRIIDSHAGQISVANMEPPLGLGGAMFTVRLPADGPTEPGAR